MLRGWRWLWVILALLGLAFVLRAGLVAFAGYVLLGVYLLSRYLAREWITNLSAERAGDFTPREVGDSLDVTLKVSNSGKLPVGWVLVEEMLPAPAVRPPRPKVSVKGGRIRVLYVPAGGTKTIKYKLTFNSRGYYPIGPALIETGDVFGLHRRHRRLTVPRYVMVYPRILPIRKYDFASDRPIGEVRLANRLFEDPTRTAGVRPYMLGDPLQRVHWRATARTGQLHSRVYEPTSLAGATLLVDFHQDGYPRRVEPQRSDLVVTVACSIAYAVAGLNQQIGLASNGRDAAERIKQEALAVAEDAVDYAHATRLAAREQFEVLDATDRLRPLVVETRRGFDQFQQIREALARLEFTDGLTFAELVVNLIPRLPRDATVIALVPKVSVEAAVALGHLRRQGFAVSVLLVGVAEDGSDERVIAAGRLLAEGIRDVRMVNTEADLMSLGDRSAVAGPAEYGFSVGLA